ncbi:bifunctional diguanylate cyclase/phosphodiesterase [Kaistia dalseonensis]|uniref:Diguanylate cyclase (GGDEF)-like protein n=1 Tax=Kaistia dalseonensis TaxID=410840 RepID=A0ABU0H3L7_9HYPH|nr:bifunctional diguanylate cyclase/phosphodiesterase [Kaistia dalseonensis]MCX5494312.1 bifunctional diguanylate cyclase/phosphodiesterase [Kaistia dalseonensis]MDQ0436893.1 diguanylate cyclase (GGDEF)-like protein [Kaistia dalseonensis]
MKSAKSARADVETGQDVEAILASVGEVAYRWSLEDDRLSWHGDVRGLFGVDSREAIATGAAFAAYLDRGNLLSRHDTVRNGVGVDEGEGVAYQIEYALRPAGVDGPLIWVEDIGRWHADGTDRPMRAEGVVRAIGERHAREQRLAFLARYDEQTGLFNRSYLLDLVDETIDNARRFHSVAAFVIIAIDDFGLINETYGFQAGDRAIAAMAQRIRGRLRDGDAIGRYAANKIGLILLNCDEQEMAGAAHRFLAAAREDVIALSDGAVSVTVSIGGVVIPRHAVSREQVMERVQDSLAVARAAGRGRFVAFSPSSEHEARRRENVMLSRRLIGALSSGRITIAFQPVVDIRSREPIFYEALLRLAHEDGTIWSAGDVVPLADRLGLARLFDLAVLDKTVETLAAQPDAILSVNVAPETAAGPDWLERLKGAVSDRPDIGPRLIVEITENSAIRNLEETARFVAGVHELGARLAIDDFGAGFTSFRNLRALSVDLVKIDGSYVEHLATNEDDQIFVRHILGLARDLGIETVAEWVQDEESAALLAEWGADSIQGNLSGRASLDPPW